MFQLAKYATATTIYFSMVKRGVVDLAQSGDWTPATGDTKVSINGGTLANTTNNPAAVAGTNGVLWSLALTTGELTGADIRVQIVDSATKAVEDQSLTIYTYGNASAKIVADYSVAALGAVMPTTAGRTLDVSAGGEAGVDWANVGSPTTTLNLSGTSTKALEPTTAGRTLDVSSTGEAGLDFANLNLPAGAIPALGIVDNGTAQSATGTTLVLRSAAAFADDELIGATVLITGGSAGVGQTRLITDSVGSTDTITVGTWTTTPTGTITYVIFGTAPSSGGGSAPTAAEIADAVWDEATTSHTTSGTFGEQCKTDIDAILVDTGTTLDGRIPAALVSGRMDASVGAMASGVITATAIAADAITAAKVADGTIDAATFAAGAINAAAIAADAIGASELAADAAAEIAAAVLSAATSTPIAADVQKINAVDVIGAGTSGDKWRA